jgi:hypothetical protein
MIWQRVSPETDILEIERKLASVAGFFYCPAKRIPR